MSTALEPPDRLYTASLHLNPAPLLEDDFPIVAGPKQAEAGHEQAHLPLPQPAVAVGRAEEPHEGPDRFGMGLDPGTLESLVDAGQQLREHLAGAVLKVLIAYLRGKATQLQLASIERGPHDMLTTEP